MDRDYEWYLEGLSAAIDGYERKVTKFLEEGSIKSSPLRFIVAELRLYPKMIDLKYQFFHMHGWASENEVRKYMERKKELSRIWQEEEAKFPEAKIVDALQSDIFNRITTYGHFVRAIKRFEMEELVNMLDGRDAIEELLPFLKHSALKQEYQRVVDFSDMILKDEYKSNPSEFDCFTIRYRTNSFIPKSYWWWYMDEFEPDAIESKSTGD